MSKYHRGDILICKETSRGGIPGVHYLVDWRPRAGAEEKTYGMMRLLAPELVISGMTQEEVEDPLNYEGVGNVNLGRLEIGYLKAKGLLFKKFPELKKYCGHEETPLDAL
jgi:hypothetical protein